MSAMMASDENSRNSYVREPMIFDEYVQITAANSMMTMASQKKNSTYDVDDADNSGFGSEYSDLDLSPAFLDLDLSKTRYFDNTSSYNSSTDTKYNSDLGILPSRNIYVDVTPTSSSVAESSFIISKIANFLPDSSFMCLCI